MSGVTSELLQHTSQLRRTGETGRRDFSSSHQDHRAGFSNEMVGEESRASRTFGLGI